FFLFSSRRRHTRFSRDWSSDVCSSDLIAVAQAHPNVYLETSAMPYPQRIRDAVRAIGPERVLFGSDGPGCQPALEVDKVRRAGRSEDEDLLGLGQPRPANLVDLEEIRRAHG